MPLQIRRGTDAERTAMTQPLAAGELIFVSNTSRLFIGNGTTLGGVPVTDYTDEQARDAAAAMFVSGTHNSITFAYDDALDKVNATVNLSDYQGVIKAAAFNGSVVANDSSLLIDGNTGKFNLSGSVGTDIIPDTDVAYDLGSAAYRFRDLYLSGSSIKLGAATITATGTAVNLPAGSTIGGSAIGIPGGDLNVNIVADDSTVIVNTTTEVVTAQGGFVGNVTGNVNGVVTGTAGSSLVGNVTGNINGIVTGTAGSTIIGNVNGIVTGAAGSTIIGNVTGNVNGVVTGTAGSSLIGNVTGNLTGNSDGYHTGDVKGSVFGDDSTILVDAVSGTLRTSAIVLSGSNITASQLNIGTAASPLTSLYINTQHTDVPVRLYGKLATFAGNFSGPFTSRYGYRGTLTSPQIVQNSDFISGDIASAYVGNEGIGANGYAFVGVTGFAHETGAPISNTSTFLKGFWYVTLNDGAAVDFNNSLTFTAAGILSAPILATTVYSTAGTAIPSASARGIGARAFVSDATVATFGSVYAGGSTNKVPVYSDGTAWRIG